MGQELREIQDALRIPIYICDKISTYGGEWTVGDFESKDPIWIKFNSLSRARFCVNHFISFVDKKESSGLRKLAVENMVEKSFESSIEQLNKSNLVRYILLVVTISIFVFCLNLFSIRPK